MEENNNDIKTLLQENLKLNQEILSICQKIEHHNKMARIYGFIKTLIILVPLLIGVFYLIPYIGDGIKAITGYQQTMQDLLK